MCDTFIALAPVTREHHTLLAKNSDREPDEAQAIVHYGRVQTHESKVRCTFIEIPQVSETYECILSKPFQMWGAEMGVNEFGVAIGNEAVFTKVSHPKRNQGLTGMDMLRLALERSRSATQAVDTLTELLERWTQDACGGYRDRNFFYHNSFIIADPREGWIVETAGTEWAATRVRDIGSISNRLSLTSADRLSKGAIDFARSKGWWDGVGNFNFSKAYSDRLYTWLGRATQRQTCTREACEVQRGQLAAEDAMMILETHNLDADHFTPRKANTGSVCMHRTSVFNPSDTTGSMVAALREACPHTIWLTGTSFPCLSVYVPYFLGTDSLQRVRIPGERPDGSLWWRARQLHQWISKDYRKRKAMIQEERTKLQQSFVDGERALLAGSPTSQELKEFSDLCLTRLELALDTWISGIKVG